MTLQEILEKILPAQRLIYTGQRKPKTYCTYQNITENTAASADDMPLLAASTQRVTLFCKGDYEAVLKKITKALRDNGYYINSIDGEDYETDTGYYKVPINIQKLKSEV